ncbi:MAG: uroporphyrinogen-III C-methyltransferase [Deltaproteobacteria bacterium]|nr:uroporphyrinogen-III C-methyltransferase [Deltaproteobacteria bacterium]
MKTKGIKKDIKAGKKKKPGRVYLAGAGPGDPELLTLKTKRILGEADVIVYDSLIAEEILSYAKEGCEIIYAGKRSSNHALPQYSINELLSEKAKTNNIVLRLKGGDPYLFGRGGEEAERLFKDDIPFEVIPGISSSFAVPAYAGIPLTHRDYASTVAIVTGHEGEHKEKSTINWKGLSGADTIVILMGYKNLDSNTKNLIKAGKDKNTPCAVIQEGTTSNQKAAVGTLSTIVEEVKKKGLKSPLILIVGNVVKLRNTLNWFEKRPLSGLKVMVTRGEGQAGTLSEKLKGLGAFVISLPLIKILKDGVNVDKAKIDKAVKNIKKYDYLIFTSANAVSAFFERYFSKGMDARALSGKKIISVGKVSSLELKKYGIVPDIVPPESSQAGIIDVLKDADIKGKKILFPQALKINKELSEFLASKGAQAENLPVYETIVPEESKEAMREIFNSLKKTGKNIGLPDSLDLSSFLVTFTSYSTVENFANALEDIKKGLLKKVIRSGVKFASIGKKTAEYALGFGIKSDIISKDVSIDSLVDGIVSFYKKGDNI